MDQEAFRKLLAQWASEDVYIGQLTWEEGDALAEYLAKWHAAQQSVQSDGAYCSCFSADVQLTLVNGKCEQCGKPPRQ